MGFFPHRGSKVIHIVFFKAVMIGRGVAQIIEGEPGIEKSVHEPV
jgi:hypothetical protein